MDPTRPFVPRPEPLSDEQDDVELAESGGHYRLKIPEPPPLTSENGSLDASFPFPAGRTADTINWSGLNLRLAVEFNGTRVTTGASFSRVVVAYASEPNVTVGFGVGYYGH